MFGFFDEWQVKVAAVLCIGVALFLATRRMELKQRHEICKEQLACARKIVDDQIAKGSVNEKTLYDLLVLPNGVINHFSMFR